LFPNQTEKKLLVRGGLVFCGLLVAFGIMPVRVRVGLAGLSVYAGLVEWLLATLHVSRVFDVMCTQIN